MENISVKFTLKNGTKTITETVEAPTYQQARSKVKSKYKRAKIINEQVIRNTPVEVE